MYNCKCVSLFNILITLYLGKSFKKDGSGGRIRTDNISIMNLELCRWIIFVEKNNVLNK